MTPTEELPKCFRRGATFVAGDRVAKVEQVRRVRGIPLSGRVTLFDAVSPDRLAARLKYPLAARRHDAVVATTAGRVALVMVTVRASPVVRWQADAEFCSTYGRVAMMGDEPFRALLDAIDDKAFPHSYFDDVIDTHSDDSDDEVRLIDAPPAPPLLLFVDKQMGGRAYWGLAKDRKPSVLMLDLFRANPW